MPQGSLDKFRFKLYKNEIFDKFQKFNEEPKRKNNLTFSFNLENVIYVF